MDYLGGGQSFGMGLTPPLIPDKPNKPPVVNLQGTAITSAPAKVILAGQGNWKEWSIDIRIRMYADGYAKVLDRPPPFNPFVEGFNSDKAKQAINDRITDGDGIIIGGVTKPELEDYKSQAKVLLKSEYREWVELDHKAVAEIHTSISSSIQVKLASVAGVDTAAMGLRYLSHAYGTSTTYRYGYERLDDYLRRLPVFEPDMGGDFALVQGELNRLNSLRRADYMSLADLIDQIHRGRDILSRLGKRLDDIDTTLMLINALGAPFAAFFHQFREVAVGRVDFRQIVEAVQDEDRKMMAVTAVVKDIVATRAKAVVVLKRPCGYCGAGASHSADRCWILHPELRGVKK